VFTTLRPICDDDELYVFILDMGAIDATLLRTGNDIYLIWKDDGNAVGQPTWIWARRLSPDGLSFNDNNAYQLMREDQGWEGNLVEGVSKYIFFVRISDRYYSLGLNKIVYKYNNSITDSKKCGLYKTFSVIGQRSI